MALLGMGANMQYNGNFPGYCSRINLNMEANSSTWPINNMDKMFDRGPFYNGFLSSFPPNQVLGYPKEVLKQMMLKHETIFRDQIHELHRLYSRQRALMDEMRRNELYKPELRLETSKSNSVLSHVSSECAQKTCHAPSLPWVNPACGGLSVSGAENVQFPLSSIQGKSTKACPDPAQTEGCLKDFALLESKCKKIGKKVLDLQLPAYVYVDSEEEESLEDGKVPKVLDLSNYTSKGITQVVCNGDVNPFHGSNELMDVFCEEVSTSVLKKSTALADLNEPVKFEEEAASKSDFVGPTSCRESPCLLVVSQKTKSTFQISSEEIIQNTCTRWDFESRSDVVLSEKKERKREWPSFSDEAGFIAENLSMLPESSKEELQQANQPPTFHLLTKSYQEVQTKRAIFSVESFGRNHGSLNDSQPGPSSASYMCTSRELVPHADVAISGSSPAAPCRKPECDMVQNPIAVQALPCFNTTVSLGSSKSSIGRPGLTGDISHSVQDSFCNSYQSESKRFRVHPPSFSFDNVNSNNNHELTSEHQGLSNYVQGSMDMKSSKSINLNFIPNCCSSDVEVSQSQCIQSTDGIEKLEELTGGLAPLKVKQVHDGRPEKGSEDSTQVESVLLKAYSECIPDVDPKKFEASDSPSNRRILGFPTYEKPHISSDQCSSHASQSETHQNADECIENTRKDVLDINLTCDSVPDSGKCLTASEFVLENGLDKKHEGFGSHIDLNSCINEDESSPMHSLSIEVDLQAPASPENKECSPPRGESNETLLEAPSQSSRQEDADLPGELMRIAAEAIISISSSEVQICIEKTACKMSEAPSSDSLHWFAGIVSSVVGEPENESGKVLSSKYSNHDDDECLPEGIDYFEAMTLRLTETKEEECFCKCNVQKEEERGAILLRSQPRKGRTRRGRQRKDFQSEILPSLASLSRYEVTEDLQTIGGLMEAAGSRWETGSLRNAGRSGSTRGRRRSCVPSSSVAENAVGSLLKQQTANSEKGIEERNLIGWGKITRRRRGQRHPVSNPQLILGQV